MSNSSHDPTDGPTKHSPVPGGSQGRTLLMCYSGTCMFAVILKQRIMSPPILLVIQGCFSYLGSLHFHEF